MSENEFKVGDRVMCTDNGALGIVTVVDIDEGKGINNGYEVRFDDGSEEWVLEEMLTHSDEPPYDPKTAFLSELKELLERYNAKLNAWGDETYTTICIAVGDVELYYSYDHYKGGNSFPLTPDNIMDYEKD